MKQVLYTSKAGVNRWERGVPFIASTKQTSIYPIEFTVSEEYILGNFTIDTVEIDKVNDADL